MTSLTSSFKVFKQPLLVGLMLLLILVFSLLSVAQGAEEVINRQLQASIVSHDWPTTPESPLCEAFAFIESTPTKHSMDREMIRLWKRFYVEALLLGTRNSTEDASSSSSSFAGRGKDDDEEKEEEKEDHQARDDSMYQRAVKAAFTSISKGPPLKGTHLDLPLMEYALSTRAHAPFCEMHRSLAQAALSSISAQVQEIPEAFIVWQQKRNRNIDDDHDDDHHHHHVVRLLCATRIGHTGQLEFVNSGFTYPDAVWASTLPDEDPLYLDEDFMHADNSTTRETTVLPAILYGSFGSKHFASLYRALVKQRIPFVVRHMALEYERKGQTQPTVLQGYGVRLDIRNVEYKSFDDKHGGNQGRNQGHASPDVVPNDNGSFSDQDPSTWTAETWKDKFINGIDPTLLVKEKKKGFSQEMKSFFRDYLPFLEESIMEESSNSKPDGVFIPPKSELRQLSVQAAMVISQSKDPLWTLQLLSQNLPSFAAMLNNIFVPEDFTSRIEYTHQLYFNQDKLMRLPTVNDAVIDFSINGRRMKVDRPSFNAFELINVFREENDLMKSIDEHFGFDSHVRDVVTDFITMGKDAFYGQSNVDDNDKENSARIDEPKLRVDVGSGYRGAVIYLNDIEKDVEYRDWPRSVERAIYSVQFGGPLVIRRNVFTVLFVLDPLNTNQSMLETLRMSIQMIQSGMPLRVGIVFANDSDLKQCKNNLERYHDTDDVNCLLSNDHTTISDKNSNEVTPETIMKLYQYNVRKFGKSIRLPYLYLLMEQLKSGMSVKSLSNINESVLEKLGIEVDDPLSDVKDAIEYDPPANSNVEETYQNSVKFAVRKNIQSGDAFLNGIPFSLGSPRDFEQIIMEEVQRILGKMMNGEITDLLPRSIYAMLLKGRHVHSAMHPSLSETDPCYIVVMHNICRQRLTLPDPTNKEVATIAIDYVTDFVTDDSLTTLLSFLKAMKALSTSESAPFAFRVFPSNVESLNSFLNHVFAEARKFSLDELTDFVNVALNNPDLRICTPNSTCPYYEEVKLSFSARGLSFSNSSSDTDNVHVKIPNKYDSSAIILVNGRVFLPKDSSIQLRDLQVLMALENDTSNKIAKAIANDFSPDELCGVVSQVAAYLGEKFFSTESLTNLRSNIEHFSDDVINNMIHFSWNDGDNAAGNESRVKVRVVLDPLTEASQRVAPLLRTIRDNLELPLELIIVPSFITDDSSLPLTSYYRFVSEINKFETMELPKASFQGLPTNQVLTIRMDVAEPWDIQQSDVVQDTDNLRCDPNCCGDEDFIYHLDNNKIARSSFKPSYHMTKVEYKLNSLLFFGQCYDVIDKSPPNGLQLTLVNSRFNGLLSDSNANIEISPEGSVSESKYMNFDSHAKPASGTLVMKTVGYWQLRTNPGVWQLEIAQNTRGAEIYDMMEGTIRDGHIISDDHFMPYKTLVMKDFLSRMEVVLVQRKKGYENADLLLARSESEQIADDNMVHVFSLATGHLYERFLKIMMLSVTKRTSAQVKFWLFENFLSPSFKESALAMATQIGCEVEFVTYKWPEWLRAQKDKQRIIWGYKILFLDVLFPLDLKKIIYVDADQVVRGDLKELWDMDLEGAPYGYTPMCESREETKGYQFWREGFWTSHLRGKPYHISALYVVDLQRFRRELVGDQLRAVYQQLTADPNNLSNLDQDLPNYTQHQIKIFSLPQDWLWCETWCSEESKKTAKTIDLCNNPQHKEAKVSMAKRIIDGELFHESWVELAKLEKLTI
eukprot:CAMPEP_0176501380 /NCGR_PEP_ID=MMETSP0200_2-20121128/14128_1 /TAXON_ID=947934 /ORGANISM="Chaetoceros sp., Strain GSL56" /LENGTH=1737 /DNA_ID=CAMNT_0017900259 /DNA_START=262 /DNA_END=5475 /DNA_ORIENTATION=+